MFEPLLIRELDRAGTRWLPTVLQTFSELGTEGICVAPSICSDSGTNMLLAPAPISASLVSVGAFMIPTVPHSLSSVAPRV